MPPRLRPDGPPAATNARQAHILVVDDKPLNRKVAEALCGMFDFTTECAVDGMGAVEAARGGRFDVILMDINMPAMDGIAAANAIRALEGAAGLTPIIALTGDVAPEACRRYFGAGMCAVVEKPIRSDQLFIAIQTALNARQALARRASVA
jgi:CheY-like chemotaxis protein